MDATQARELFADVLNTAAYGGGRVLIARRGRLLCAIISLDELERLRALPPVPDPIEEANKFWEEGKRILAERLQRQAEERARAEERALAGQRAVAQLAALGEQPVPGNA